MHRPKEGRIPLTPATSWPAAWLARSSVTSGCTAPTATAPCTARPFPACRRKVAARLRAESQGVLLAVGLSDRGGERRRTTLYQVHGAAWIGREAGGSEILRERSGHGCHGDGDRPPQQRGVGRKSIDLSRTFRAAAREVLIIFSSISIFIKQSALFNELGQANSLESEGYLA